MNCRNGSKSREPDPSNKCVGRCRTNHATCTLNEVTWQDKLRSLHALLVGLAYNGEGRIIRELDYDTLYRVLMYANSLSSIR